MHYLGYSRRWRDIPKPTIAAVQGQCIAGGGGGLMLWPCDLIIAADNAMFSDPVARMGIGGVEYHGHTWELGPRKAKEMLFTARRFGAAEAQAAGMVNRVVPLEDLHSETMALAHEIAQMHPLRSGPVQAGRQPHRGHPALRITYPHYARRWPTTSPSPSCCEAMRVRDTSKVRTPGQHREGRANTMATVVNDNSKCGSGGNHR